MSKFYDAIVIGAGHNGMITAAALATRGKSVLVLEKNKVTGGCLAVDEFHHGFNASVATPAGQELRPKVVNFLNLDFYGYEFVPHDPVTFVPLGEDSHLALWRDLDKACDSIAKVSPPDADKYREFTEFIGRVVKATHELLDSAPTEPDTQEALGLVDLANLGLKLRMLGKTDLHRVMRLATMSLKDLLDEWFEFGPLKAALAQPALAGHRYGPYAPGTAALLVYDRLAGPYGLPRGGFAQKVELLDRVLEDNDVDVELGAEVTRIVSENGTATSVLTADGKEYRTRQIYSAVDPKTTFSKLVAPTDLPPTFRRKVKNLLARGSTTILNLALEEFPLFECLTGRDQRDYLGGRIQFTQSLEELEKASDCVKYGVVPAEPVLCATLPTVQEPRMAPNGRHLLQVEIRWTPYPLVKGSWKRQKKFFKQVVEKLENYIPGLSQQILEQKVVTPEELESDYGLYGGHIFQGERNLHQLLFGRPLGGWSRYRTPLRNLYLCGAGAHPGASTCGASGLNAAKLALEAQPGAKKNPLSTAKEVVKTPVGAGLAAAGLGLLGAGLAVSKAVKKRKKKELNGKSREDAND